MFSIKDGREFFYQWDKDRYIAVADSTVNELHFCNGLDSCSLKAEVTDGLAPVPNELLESDFPIKVYAYCNDGYTITEAVFKVKARSKPAEAADDGEAGGTVEKSLLAKVLDRTITRIMAEDLAGATEIGQHAFYKCEKLTEIVIPDTITLINSDAFRYCYGLTEITIPDSVVKISSTAFGMCTELTSITIGKGITSFDTFTFDVCKKLKRMTIHATTPPTLYSNTLYGVPADCAIYVPAEAVNAYKVKTNWSARADYIFPIEEA